MVETQPLSGSSGELLLFVLFDAHPRSSLVFPSSMLHKSSSHQSSSENHMLSVGLEALFQLVNSSDGLMANPIWTSEQPMSQDSGYHCTSSTGSLTQVAV